MKKTFLLLLVSITLTGIAQSRKPAKMAPIYTSGYYVTYKNDTIQGKIQTNPDSETDFYTGFFFVAGKAKKSKRMDFQKAKAYGFCDKDFAMINNEGDKLFAQRLTTGRLRFYEYKFHGKVDGNPAIESEYYIRDIAAEGADAALAEPKKLSGRFYKKTLKPYLKDQPMLWSDLDKYTFDKEKVIQTINEFNQFYATAAN